MAAATFICYNCINRCDRSCDVMQQQPCTSCAGLTAFRRHSVQCHATEWTAKVEQKMLTRKRTPSTIARSAERTHQWRARLSKRERQEKEGNESQIGVEAAVVDEQHGRDVDREYEGPDLSSRPESTTGKCTQLKLPVFDEPDKQGTKSVGSAAWPAPLSMDASDSDLIEEAIMALQDLPTAKEQLQLLMQSGLAPAMIVHIGRRLGVV